MKISRRGLLQMLAVAAADPERLIFEPGRRLISIPKKRPSSPSLNAFTADLDGFDINAALERRWDQPDLIVCDMATYEYYQAVLPNFARPLVVTA